MGMPVICASKTTPCQAKVDIVESVALMEAALSHILNAEGEKLQKIIACERSSKVLLEANSSVESMVCAVTRLEEVLVDKLKLVFKQEKYHDCRCGDNHEPHGKC